MNTEYPKIQTFFKRDPATEFKHVLMGQYALPVFAYLAFADWQWTEKFDGMNVRVIFDGGKVSFAGRTDKAELPPKLFAHLAQQFTVDSLIKVLDPAKLSPECPAVLYGEGVGPGIGKHGDWYGTDHSFVLFDVAVGGMYFQRDNVGNVADRLGIPSTQIMCVGSMWEAVLFAREEKRIEGLVCRPVEELLDRTGRRVVTKIKYADFPHKV